MSENCHENGIGKMLGEEVGKMIGRDIEKEPEKDGYVVILKKLKNPDDLPEDCFEEDDSEDDFFDESGFDDDCLDDDGIKTLRLRTPGNILELLLTPVMLALFFYFWGLLRPLEEALVSNGHLQFMNGTFVFRAAWVRVFHYGMLLIAAVTADRVFCRIYPRECTIYIFFLMLIGTIFLCMQVDHYLLKKEPGIVPIPDRYHKMFEEGWQKDPGDLIVEKGLREPYMLEVDGEHFLYRMNYNGIFSNDFSFIYDRPRAEIRIPLDGNDRFFKECVRELPWNTPGAVTVEIFTDVEPCRPLLFSGGYDSEKKAFVIPASGPVQDARYGYCVVRWSGTDYTARQLFGERSRVSLMDLVCGKK